MQASTGVAYTSFSTRLWTAAFDFTFSLVIGMLAALPCGIWYNSSHPRSADGSGSGVSLWALVIIVLLAPLLAQTTLATSPGSVITSTHTRIFARNHQPVRWYRGLFHAAIFPAALAGAYFAAGAWLAVAVLVVGYVISPLVDRKHRTLSEWVSGTLVLSEVGSGFSQATAKKTKPTLDVVIGPFTKAQRLTYALSMVILFAASVAASFIIAH
jgi:hypothetical protein